MSTRWFWYERNSSEKKIKLKEGVEERIERLRGRRETVYRHPDGKKKVERGRRWWWWWWWWWWWEKERDEDDDKDDDKDDDDRR